MTNETKREAAVVFDALMAAIPGNDSPLTQYDLFRFVEKAAASLRAQEPAQQEGLGRCGWCAVEYACFDGSAPCSKQPASPAPAEQRVGGEPTWYENGEDTVATWRSRANTMRNYARQEHARAERLQVVADQAAAENAARAKAERELTEARERLAAVEAKCAAYDAEMEKHLEHLRAQHRIDNKHLSDTITTTESRVRGECVAALEKRAEHWATMLGVAMPQQPWLTARDEAKSCAAAIRSLGPVRTEAEIRQEQRDADVAWLRAREEATLANIDRSSDPAFVMWWRERATTLREAAQCLAAQPLTTQEERPL